MTKMKQTFDLSKLIEYLHQTFVFTEDVKHILKSNCNEAIISLKPWCMEVNSQQDLSKDVCTCPKAETEVEEIAAGISKTLLQAQQLREKLSFNIIKGQNSKRLNISKIYNSQTLGNRQQKQKTNFNTGNKKLLSSKDVNTVKQNMQEINFNRRSKGKVVKEDVNSNKEIKSYDQQLIAGSGKFLGTKNFLVINKWNVKNKNEIMKHKVGESSKSCNSMVKLSYTASDDRLSATSTNELKCLLQKVSSNPNSDSFSKMHSTKCPLHEKAISKCEKNVATIDVVDSINLINIPAEIIKPLKVYHTYLNNEFSKKSTNEKQQKVNQFLMEFHKIDKVIQKSLVQKAHNISLLTKYMSFFQILFSENIETFNSNNIKTMYTELQFTWKTFEMKESDTVRIFQSDLQKMPLSFPFNLTEWMSNGIWNPSCSGNFKEMSTMCSIRYTDKNYLLFLFELLQQLQHIDYYKNLINMILKEVLPNMKVSFDSTQLEYIKMYKMIYILYQGLNPKVPVLVSTSK